MPIIHYLAYGSNLHPLRLAARAPSARVVGVVEMPGYMLAFHKRSIDGSGKCLVHTEQGASCKTYGVLYAFDAQEKAQLDAVEEKIRDTTNSFAGPFTLTRGEVLALYRAGHSSFGAISTLGEQAQTAIVGLRGSQLLALLNPLDFKHRNRVMDDLSICGTTEAPQIAQCMLQAGNEASSSPPSTLFRRGWWGRITPW